MARRVLFVDDDPGIRETLPAILRFHGFEVTSVATVGQALEEIISGQFDVLIADLNLGLPGDGFTVVSAMRRTQPDCATVILTGYPALETALQAIRNQVDDYLMKPARIPELMSAIESALAHTARQPPTATKRVADILTENATAITERVSHEMQSHPVLGTLSISDRERTGLLGQLIEGLAKQLQSADPNHVPEEAMAAAALRGTLRRQQGYDLAMLVENIRLFGRVIFDMVHDNLLSINLSYLMVDMKRLNDSLGLQLQRTILQFVEGEEGVA
jgi:DNA-binding response OmpR family regulator